MPERKFNYCPSCGSKLLKSNAFNTNFCHSCGHKLNKTGRTLVRNVQCTVCHELILPRTTQIIKCSFCGSQYHYSCVYEWLTRHNSCPMCQNVFLNPKMAISRKHKR